jgi:hypothetical protein
MRIAPASHTLRELPRQKDGATERARDRAGDLGRVSRGKCDPRAPRAGCMLRLKSEHAHGRSRL